MQPQYTHPILGVSFDMPLWYDNRLLISMTDKWISELSEKEWHDFIKPMEDSLNPQNRVVNLSISFLPVGKKLYHGTLDSMLNFANIGRSNFFGMDIIISLWYLMEMLTPKYLERCRRPIGLLHVFEICEKLPYTYESEKMTEVASSLSIPVVHPQVSIRHGVNGQLSDKRDVSTEITIPWCFLPHLKWIGCFKVDIYKLAENVDKDIYQFNPVDAILYYDHKQSLNPLSESLESHIKVKYPIKNYNIECL